MLFRSQRNGANRHFAHSRFPSLFRPVTLAAQGFFVLVAKVYHEETEPLKDYYQKQGKLFVVEGQEEVADTTKLTLAAVEA